MRKSLKPMYKAIRYRPYSFLSTFGFSEYFKQLLDLKNDFKYFLKYYYGEMRGTVNPFTNKYILILNFKLTVRIDYVTCHGIIWDTE